jgi:hypothetical protein
MVVLCLLVLLFSFYEDSKVPHNVKPTRATTASRYTSLPTNAGIEMEMVRKGIIFIMVHFCQFKYTFTLELLKQSSVA